MRGVIALVLLAVVLATGCDRPAKMQKVVEPPREVQVIQILRINEAETVKVITVPSPLLPGDTIMDRTCLIYTNTEARQTVMKCLSAIGNSGD